MQSWGAQNQPRLLLTNRFIKEAPKRRRTDTGTMGESVPS